MKIILGTRGSALALAQAELARQALCKAEPSLEIEIKKIITSGDRKLDLSLISKSAAGAKGLFTREIESALLAKKIDCAVHSLKDLPGDVSDPKLTIAAVLERADTADLLIAKTARSLDAMPAGAAIGTSSVRRQREIEWMRPDLRVEEIRGNVPTRIQKLRDSKTLEAILLAKAGIMRLGIDLAEFAVSEIAMLPAIGQGAIALQCRADDEATRSLLAKINHAPTYICIRAERELLRLLQGDCRLPVGARAELSGTKLRMRAILFSETNASQNPRKAEAEINIEETENAPELLAAKIFAQIHD